MNDIFLIGDVGFDITLESVVEAVKNSDKSQPLNVHIHSPGGNVFDGIAIYNFLKGLDQEVNTISTGLVASIASIFFLAGKSRTVNSTDSFLIHLPSGRAFGNAEDLEKTAEDLREIENKLSDIYVNETDLTKKEALALMEKDEMLPVDFLLEKGFVNEIIEFKAVATFNNKKMSTETVTKTEVEGLFAKFENKIKDFFNKNEPENKVVKDANGVNIDFIDLKKDAEVSVGSEAMIDNKKAEGEFTMPDGNKWTFLNGKLDSISEEQTDLEKVQAENSSLKDELQTSAESLEAKTEELEAQKAVVENMQAEFTTFKNEVTSKFDFDGKTNRKSEANKGTNEQGVVRTPIK